MDEIGKIKSNASADLDEAFVRAANRKDLAAMGEALADGANVNVANVRGITPLHAGVMARHSEMVSWLAKRGANPSLKTAAGDSALHDAAKLEDQDFMKSLVSVSGVDVNIVNSLGTTPLMEAAGAGRIEAAKLLVRAGADVNSHSKQGSSALLISAARHNYEMVKMLLSNGANANDADSYGVSALIAAATVIPGESASEETPQIASAKTMAELIRAGASVNTVAKSGNTALAEASRCMNRRGMMLLLDSGADAEVHSTAGVSGEMTPLMVGAYKHDMELLEKILSKKIDINYTNNKGYNALMMAMSAPIENEKDQAKAKLTIEALLKAGAKLSQGPSAKIGLGHYGVLTESKDLLAAARDQGVLDQAGEGGASALFYAVAMRKMEMINALKDLGASFVATDDKKRNVLHMLASQPYPAQVTKAIELMKAQNDEKRKAEAVKLETETKQSALDYTEKLIAFGCDINGKDDAGNTPLHLALLTLAFGRVDRSYIDFLVKKGADISIRNEKEDSAFVQVIKIGHVDLAESWARKLIECGKASEVVRAIYDVSWAAPEHESQVAAIQKVFEKLIPMGAAVNFKDDDGQFPLLIASATNQEALVSALLDLKADVGLRNNEGEVAAFHSIKENHPNITKILFERGCDPDSERNDGESLMTIAYRHHLSTAVQQIIDARTLKSASAQQVEDGSVSGAQGPLKKLGI